MVRLGRVLFGERGPAGSTPRLIGPASRCRGRAAGLIVIPWPTMEGPPRSHRRRFVRPGEGERAVLDRWKSTDLFRRSLELRKDGKPYVFYEGPPTANGKPASTTSWTRSFKDSSPATCRCAGMRSARKGGWDTHGLPVELEVRRSLKISGKRQIEEFGVAPVQ